MGDMSANIQGALEDIELIKNTIVKTKVSFKRIVNFYLWIGMYYFSNLCINLLEIISISKGTIQSQILFEAVGLFLLIIMIGIYFYYRKMISHHENYLSLFLIDMWGYTFIITKVLSILIINFTSFNILQVLPIWCITMGIAINLLSTGLLLNSKFIKIIAILFSLLNVISFKIPDIHLNLLNDMTLTYSSNIISANFLILIVCICLYFYFKNQGKKL